MITTTPGPFLAAFTVKQGESLQLLRELPDESVDAIITDPPYSSGGMFRGDRSKDTGQKYVIDQGQNDQRPDFFGDNRDGRGFAYWCALWFAECHRVAKPGAMLLSFIDWRQLPALTDSVQAGGWVWRGICPWDKTQATRPQKGWFRAQCEYIVTAAKGMPAMLDQTGKSDAPCLPGFFSTVPDLELPGSVACGVEKGDESIHQTQKPVDLMRMLVRLCPKGGLVLDPFAGSGSTGVAALMEGRRFLGFERSHYFADAARKRCAGAVQGGNQETIGGTP